MNSLTPWRGVLVALMLCLAPAHAQAVTFCNKTPAPVRVALHTVPDCPSTIWMLFRCHAVKGWFTLGEGECRDLSGEVETPIKAYSAHVEGNFPERVWGGETIEDAPLLCTMMGDFTFINGRDGTYPASLAAECAGFMVRYVPVEGNTVTLDRPLHWYRWTPVPDPNRSWWAYVPVEIHDPEWNRYVPCRFRNDQGDWVLGRWKVSDPTCMGVVRGTVEESATFSGLEGDGLITSDDHGNAPGHRFLIGGTESGAAFSLCVSRRPADDMAFFGRAPVSDPGTCEYVDDKGDYQKGGGTPVLY